MSASRALDGRRGEVQNGMSAAAALVAPIMINVIRNIGLVTNLVAEEWNLLLGV